MNKLKMCALLAASFSLLFLGCSKKNSDEACRHETTMNLDSGNYDAVLASGCADAMQRGAAYFGRAGFDVTNVINRFIQTGVLSGPTITTASHFKEYMTEMVTKVTSSTLSDLDNSITQYTGIPATADSFRDARFNVSIVDAVKGLSLLKSVIDVSSLGTLNTTCDMNANGKPDEIDATSCALLTSASEPCVIVVSGVTTTLGTILPGDNLFPVTFPDNTANTFRGLKISVTGSGINSTSCPSPNQYKKLLFQPAGTTSWVVATTTPQTCLDSQGREWPCPVLNADGTPMDLVSAVDDSLNNAIDAMNSSMTITTTNVQTAIQDIKTTACPTGTCSSTDISNYLQTYQQ